MREALVLFAFSAVTFAQSSITGTVRDQFGAPLEQITVQAKNTGSGKTATTVSKLDGSYAIPELPPGTYEVTANPPSMQAYKSPALVLNGATVQHDVKISYNTQLGTLGEDLRSAAADAARHKPPTGTTPRTADGKPDLSGVWWSPRTVDAGKPEWLPAAEAVAKERGSNNRKDSPQARCLPSAVLRFGPLFQLVQSKDYMVSISDDDSPGFHQIYLDGRKHPADPNPAWYGHNVGHWEGDTLVVDRVGFHERAWLDQAAHPHSDKLHVVERYRRPDAGHLEIEVTVEDPGVLKDSFTTKAVAELANEEIFEFICPENERDVQHFFGN